MKRLETVNLATSYSEFLRLNIFLDKKFYTSYYQYMAIECMRKCPVIKAIERNIAGNIESGVLTEFFNNGLNSARRASDECQGPGESADTPQEAMQAITLAEPLKVCGWNASIQNEVTLTTR